MAESVPDVATLIREQHVMIKQLFDSVQKAPPGERSTAFEPLVRLLAVHETAEEEIVYPAIASQSDAGREVADARKQEEDAAKKALAEIEGMDASSAEFVTAIGRLRADIEAHAASEEAEVLPLLAQMDPDRQRTMGKAFKAAESMAPTHAHRMAPESATGNLLVGPFVAIVDRVRDAIRDTVKS
jgi:hemerythrin superfamily protein